MNFAKAAVTANNAKVPTAQKGQTLFFGSVSVCFSIRTSLNDNVFRPISRNDNANSRLPKKQRAREWLPFHGLILDEMSSTLTDWSCVCAYF